MRLLRFIGQLFRFCGETVKNWITYGLFVTSLPQLLEFLPATSAKAAQDWMRLNIGSRATFWLAVLGLIFAAFLAWKSKDDELARRRIEPKTIASLANRMTQSGDLFQAGQRVVSAEGIDAWNTEFNQWFTTTHEMIRKNISEAEAALFREVSGGTLIWYYKGSPEHNQRLNTLRGYQETLRHVIERYSDR